MHLKTVRRIGKFVKEKQYLEKREPVIFELNKKLCDESEKLTIEIKKLKSPSISIESLKTANENLNKEIKI